MNSQVQQATVVKIYPTRIWIESDMMVGERVVMMQHEGCEPFEYAVFNYDYRYTSNVGTHEAAENLARSLGSQEPIEYKSRVVKTPSEDEIREAIKGLQEMLVDIEASRKSA